MVVILDLHRGKLCGIPPPHTLKKEEVFCIFLLEMDYLSIVRMRSCMCVCVCVCVRARLCARVCLFNVHFWYGFIQ